MYFCIIFAYRKNRFIAFQGITLQGRWNSSLKCCTSALKVCQLNAFQLLGIWTVQSMAKSKMWYIQVLYIQDWPVLNMTENGLSNHLQQHFEGASFSKHHRLWALSPMDMYTLLVPGWTIFFRTPKFWPYLLNVVAEIVTQQTRQHFSTIFPIFCHILVSACKF